MSVLCGFWVLDVGFAAYNRKGSYIHARYRVVYQKEWTDCACWLPDGYIVKLAVGYTSGPVRTQMQFRSERAYKFRDTARHA